MADVRNIFFSVFFRDSRMGLHRYVQRLVRSRDTAEEIVQEAFLRTYERAESGRPAVALLYSIARNLATDHYRHERAVQTEFSRSAGESLGDFDGSSVLSSGESLELTLLKEEESRLLKAAVEQLPPQCRTVFTLRMFYGYSYKEIAGKLGLSTKTVQNHMARGMRDAHRYLSRRYRGEEEGCKEVGDSNE